MNPPTDSSPLVFFHAGLGKVASTYLQDSVFPALDGICYLHRNRFRRHTTVVPRGDCSRYLLSRECGKRLDQRLREVAGYYPDARILLFFRRHDDWIASHYRRYIKNGGQLELTGYLDIVNDTGIWKREQLMYMDMIDRVQGYFGRQPFVLTYDRMLRDSDDFNMRLAQHLGATIDPTRLRRRRVHQSYSVKRLTKLRRINRMLDLEDPERLDPKRSAHRLRRRLSLYRSYGLLLATNLIGDGRIGDEALIDPRDLASIREFYADDWRRLTEFEEAQFSNRESSS
jgi:hypothetical protein